MPRCYQDVSERMVEKSSPDLSPIHILLWFLHVQPPLHYEDRGMLRQHNMRKRPLGEKYPLHCWLSFTVPCFMKLKREPWEQNNDMIGVKEVNQVQVGGFIPPGYYLIPAISSVRLFFPVDKAESQYSESQQVSSLWHQREHESSVMRKRMFVCHSAQREFN